MNMQKLTQKSIEALTTAQNLGEERHHQTIGQEHLLLALLEAEEGLIPELWQKMNISAKDTAEKVRNELDKLPRITGSYDAERVYLSSALNAALNAAESRAQTMKDDYISVEHLLLGILDCAQANVKKIFGEIGLTLDGFLKALKEVRGNTHVQGDNPEETYDVLHKYGQDLVELAKQQKLDPVIGRDDEIRNVIRILSRKTKNNPCLIGEPGVGKTAIAEGLALRIVSRTGKCIGRLLVEMYNLLYCLLELLLCAAETLDNLIVVTLGEGFKEAAENSLRQLNTFRLRFALELRK